MSFADNQNCAFTISFRFAEVLLHDAHDVFVTRIQTCGRDLPGRLWPLRIWKPGPDHSTAAELIDRDDIDSELLGGFVGVAALENPAIVEVIEVTLFDGLQ